MVDDPFAHQLDRLTRRHRDRRDLATVAQVALQHWLFTSHRFDDRFDPHLFELVDGGLGQMPASCDTDQPSGSLRHDASGT